MLAMLAILCYYYMLWYVICYCYGIAMLRYCCSRGPLSSLVHKLLHGRLASGILRKEILWQKKKCVACSRRPPTTLGTWSHETRLRGSLLNRDWPLEVVAFAIGASSGHTEPTSRSNPTPVRLHSVKFSSWLRWSSASKKP